MQKKKKPFKVSFNTENLPRPCQQHSLAKKDIILEFWTVTGLQQHRIYFSWSLSYPDWLLNCNLVVLAFLPSFHMVLISFHQLVSLWLPASLLHWIIIFFFVKSRVINTFRTIKCLLKVFLKFKDCQNSFFKREKYHALKDNIIIQRINMYYKFCFVVLKEKKKKKHFILKLNLTLWVIYECLGLIHFLMIICKYFILFLFIFYFLSITSSCIS